MAETKIAYTSEATAIAVTSWDTELTTGLSSSSALVTNTTFLYDDVQIGGSVATGTGFVAGDTFDIRAWANYDVGTSTDIGGGIAALFDGLDQLEVEGTAYQEDNMVLIATINIDQASKTFHWVVGSLNQFFGGVMPPRWGLLGTNNGTGTMAASANVSYTGITYKSE